MGLRAEGLKVHVIVAAWSWGAYLGEDGQKHGIRVRTASIMRHHVNITMCKAKANGNYMNSMIALREALSAGCDEALLLDPEGYVAEGSGENIFIVRDGMLYTPELTCALSTASRATPSSAWPANSGSRSSRSASRATRCTSPTRRSSPAPPPR